MLIPLLETDGHVTCIDHGMILSIRGKQDGRECLVTLKDPEMESLNVAGSARQVGRWINHLVCPDIGRPVEAPWATAPVKSEGG